MEVPISVTIKALETFQGFSILNAAPALENMPENAYSLANIFCLNEQEAEALTNVHFYGINDARRMIEELLKKGARTVILTLGKRGAVVNENGKIFHVPVPKAYEVHAVVDSTGGCLFKCFTQFVQL